MDRRYDYVKFLIPALHCDQIEMQEAVFVVGIRAMRSVHEIFIEKSEGKGTHAVLSLGSRALPKGILLHKD